METLRKQLRITPKEEDAIVDEYINMFVELLEGNMRRKVAGKVEELLNFCTEADHSLAIMYEISASASFIKLFVNRMRKGRKKPLGLKIERDG